MSRSHMGEWWFRVKEMLCLLWVSQLQAATAAVTAAALVFNGVPCALQRGEQGLATLEFKTAALCDEKSWGRIAHRLKPSRSPALSSLSICPTR